MLYHRSRTRDLFPAQVQRDSFLSHRAKSLTKLWAFQSLLRVALRHRSADIAPLLCSYGQAVACCFACCSSILRCGASAIVTQVLSSPSQPLPTNEDPPSSGKSRLSVTSTNPQPRTQQNEPVRLLFPRTCDPAKQGSRHRRIFLRTAGSAMWTC